MQSSGNTAVRSAGKPSPMARSAVNDTVTVTSSAISGYGSRGILERRFDASRHQEVE